MSLGNFLRLGLLAMLVAGCGPSSMATPGSTDGAAVLAKRDGRTVCPGSVLDATGTTPAAGTDAMERLQRTYEADPGFLAVIWDTSKPVIVVARADLGAWQARLAPLKTAVAPSCIDPTLLALVHQALPRMSNQGVRSGGYNAIDDAIFITGVDTEALLSELDALQPGAKVLALAAIADGTLRIDTAETFGSRQ